MLHIIIIHTIHSFFSVSIFNNFLFISIQVSPSLILEGVYQRVLQNLQTGLQLNGA